MITFESIGGVKPFIEFIKTRNWVLDQWSETSAEWKLARGEIMAALGNQCTRCGNPYRLHLHHTKGRNLDGPREGEINPTYLDPDADWEEIFEVLCPACHAQAHGRDLIAEPEPTINRPRAFIPKPIDREPGCDDTGIDGAWPPRQWSLIEWLGEPKTSYRTRETLTGTRSIYERWI